MPFLDCDSIMSKRFIDSQIWADDWFCDLEPVHKLVYIYIFSNCDISGLMKINKKKIFFDIGSRFDFDKMQEALCDKIIFREKSCLIKNYINIQYPKILKSPNAPLHISVYNQIEKNCLILDGNSLSIDYGYSIDRVQVKVKVKEKKSISESKDVLNDEISPIEKAIQDFKQFRKSIRKPLTDNAESLLMKKLESLANNEADQIAILEQSILNGWQGIFELKQPRQFNHGRSCPDNFGQPRPRNEYDGINDN